MDTAAPSVVVRTGTSLAAIIENRFLGITHGWPEMVGDSFDSEAEWSTILSDAAAAGFNLELNVDDSCAIFTRATPHGDAALLLHMYGRDYFDVSVVGVTRDAAAVMLNAFGKFLPPIPPAGDDTVPMSFWSYHPMYGGERMARRLPRLTWDGIAQNYPASIRDDLAGIASMTTAPTTGRLMAFYGPPGNGKSTFIQTLAGEWSKWCRIDYVVDPDMMFHDASYMNKVVLSEDWDDRWRLLIVEDGDEFLDTGAKSRVGYGVSRLLNLADGLVGKGLKLMVLITTNVRSVRFSKAMLRPGRCSAKIEFPSFSQDEAREWCAANDITDPAFTAETVSLAELYALKGAVG